MNGLSLILSIIAGLLLLFAGRRLFWLAAALIAFLFIFNLSAKFFGGGWLGVVIGLIIGALFAWLAVAFAKGVGYIIAALAGASGLPMLFGILGFNMSYIVLAVIGALVGILILAFAYNWGLILLTAWIGANTVVGNLAQWIKPGTALPVVVFLILFVIGISVQATQLGRKTE